jgi:hypothetical protein
LKPGLELILVSELIQSKISEEEEEEEEEEELTCNCRRDDLRWKSIIEQS